MTIDDLAQMVQRGFAETATKKDLDRFATKEYLERFATKEDFTSLDNKIDALEHRMDENFRLMREEIKMLNFAVEIDDLRDRMKRVEQNSVSSNLVRCGDGHHPRS